MNLINEWTIVVKNTKMSVWKSVTNHYNTIKSDGGWQSDNESNNPTALI